MLIKAASYGLAHELGLEITAETVHHSSGRVMRFTTACRHAQNCGEDLVRVVRHLKHGIYCV